MNMQTWDDVANFLKGYPFNKDINPPSTQLDIYQPPHPAEKVIRRFLSPEEPLFQQWYRNMASQLGLNPNPDDPRHMYDYRKAWRSGPVPFPPVGTHWPSQYKHEWHPDRFKGGIDTITGERVR